VNRLAILSNAGSGRNRSRSELLRVLDATSGVDHRVTATQSDVPEVLTELLGREPDVLAVNGGDGTVQAVLSAWADLRDAGAVPPELPPLAVLPAGSTNMTAHDLGCGGRMRRRVGDLLALRDRERGAWRMEQRSPLSVVDEAGTRRLGFCFGMGTIVRGIEYWHERLQHGGGAGEWGAGAALVRAAWGIVRRQPPFHEPAHVRLLAQAGDAAGRAEADGAVSFLLATTMRRLFLGISPFWGEGAGPLSVTWIDDGARSFLVRFPALLAGREARLPAADGYHGVRTDRVELAFDDPWAIDGEVFAATSSLALSAGPALACVRLADDLAPVPEQAG
jgi:hypothetical protein